MSENSPDGYVAYVAWHPHCDFIGWEHIGYTQEQAIELLLCDVRINDRFDTWESMLEVEPEWRIRPVKLVFLDEEKMKITKEHLKLLSNAYVGWEDCETGAPCIDCKRPYGNSFVAGDVAKILGIPVDIEDDGMSEYQKEKMLQLHYETERVLQLVLRKLSDPRIIEILLE